ncbi:unnamed protein product [Closterium sp. NIES-65]|nr:unnamed protein product [Closterium sp. NIES-65]
MASAIRVLLLAPLAVGLLATAASAARGVMGGARGMAPGEADSSDGSSSAGGAGQQRKGVRILATDTFAHHAPLPGYLDHIPRRQALATTPAFFPPPLCPACGSTKAMIRSQYLGPMWAHEGDDPLAVPGNSRPCPLPFTPFPASPPTCAACGRTTVTIRSQYVGPYDLHNDIYNMTFYNGCAYNVTSPLRVWQCFNFGNVWEGSLDNPDPNPSQYQTGDIFVQSSPGYCEMHMNRGVSGTLQMLPGETVNIVYAWTGDFRPCAQELRFSNGNSYSMTNTTDCQIAAVI